MNIYEGTQSSQTKRIAGALLLFFGVLLMLFSFAIAADAKDLQGGIVSIQGTKLKSHQATKGQNKKDSKPRTTLVKGDLNLQGSLVNSQGNVKIGDALNVTGNATFKGTVKLEDGLTVSAGTIALPDDSITDAMVADTLTVSAGVIDGTIIGATTPAAGSFTTLVVSGGLNLPASGISDAMVSDTLTSSDLVATSAVVGDAEVTDALTLSGATINNSAIGATTAASGAFTTFSASGATSLASTLGVTGEAVLRDDLLVGDTAETISNGLYALNGGEVFVAGDLGVEGKTYFDNS